MPNRCHKARFSFWPVYYLLLVPDPDQIQPATGWIATQTPTITTEPGAASNSDFFVGLDQGVIDFSYPPASTFRM